MSTSQAQELKLQTPYTNTPDQLLQWVDEIAILCKPQAVYWCNGSKEEYDNFMEKSCEKYPEK